MATFETEDGTNAPPSSNGSENGSSAIDMRARARRLSTTGGFAATAKYASVDAALEAERDAMAKLERQENHYSTLFARGDNARQTIFLLLDEPESSILATVFSTFILLLIVAGSITFVAETHPDVRDDRDLLLMIHSIETTCISVFSVEYILRVATCSQRPNENKSVFSYIIHPMNMIDAMSILPFYVEEFMKASGSTMDVAGLAVIRVLRMARVFRVLKVGSYADDLRLFAEGFKRSGEGLAVLTFLLALYLCVGGSILYMLEYDAQRAADRSGFESIPATWYFIIASMTTVGYGDHYPITNSGKLVCSICMLCGIFVLGLPIVIIGHSFDEVFAVEEKLKADRKAMLEATASSDCTVSHKSARAGGEMSMMDNPLAEKVSPGAPLATTSASTVQINYDSESFDRDAARLSLVEVLDDMYEQTGDERYHNALTELLKEADISLYENETM